MSNHTDFDPLRAHPDVDLRFVREGETRLRPIWART
jgi:adenosylcobyric acid synthase